MTSDDEETPPDFARNARISVGRLALVSMGLRDFAGKVIAYARSGQAVDDEALGRLRESVLRDMKDTETLGFSVEDEAEALRQGLRHLEEWLDEAIAKGLRPRD